MLKETSELHQIAKALTEHAKSGKKINLMEDIFKSHHAALVQEKVIEVKVNKAAKRTVGTFHADFVAGLELSEPAKLLQTLMKEKLGNLSSVKLNLSAKFGQGRSDEAKLPRSDVTDDNIKEFLELLTFAVSQPSVDELRSLINAELNAEFNLTQIDLMIDHIQAEMLNWFQDPQSQFYSYPQALKLIHSVHSHISELQLLGCSLHSKTHFDHLSSIKFQQRKLPHKMMEEFLSSNKSKILVLLTDCVFLMGIQLNQMLMNYVGRSENNYTFLELRNLIGDKMSQVVLRACERIRLVVISCELDSEKPNSFLKLSPILKQLLEKVDSCKHLKIIFLTERNCHEIFQLLQHHQHKKLNVVQCGLSDLIPKSQKILLESSILSFQGKDTKLINIFDDGRTQKMIDAKLLSSLIKGEKVALANAWSFSGQFDSSLYVKRFLCTQIVFPAVCLKENCSNHVIVVADDSNAFDRKCVEYPKADIHWMKRTGNEK